MSGAPAKPTADPPPDLVVEEASDSEQLPSGQGTDRRPRLAGPCADAGGGRRGSVGARLSRARFPRWTIATAAEDARPGHLPGWGIQAGQQAPEMSWTEVTSAQRTSTSKHWTGLDGGRLGLFTAIDCPAPARTCQRG